MSGFGSNGLSVDNLTRMKLPPLLMAAVFACSLSACGADSSGDETTARAEKAQQECRKSWAGLRSLDKQYVARPDVASALASRWDTMQASIAYYVVNADADDCGALLDKQRAGMLSLTRIGHDLRAYDMPYQLSAAEGSLGDYLETHDVSSLGKKLTAAFYALRTYAPVADSDLAPGFDELNKIDVTDDKQVKKAIKGIRLLAHQSDAFKACEASLKIIDSDLAGS